MLTSKNKRNINAAGTSDTPKLTRIERTQQIADIVLKILSCIAIVATGIWAYYQYYIKGANDWMVNLTITTEVLPYQEKLRLLVVHIKSKNPTSAKLDFEKEKGTFDLIVRKLPDKLKEGSTLDEITGEKIAEIDLLTEDLEILPSAEFDNMKTIVVPVGSTLSLTSAMEYENGTLTKEGKPDHDFVSASTVIHIDDKKSD
ncbi:hypothetical protein [Solimicrobium silvestre]|uniref:Uncharacterized protein n=1 Tax=Solimicrobium silvestre TaxID=2099400 RepID=A0A2S9H4J2_9BURK|nr:hypothetical protein [Solimicrobium silvestre]PRC94902.1 hypothetical protein S2091_0097 [Solimicrobium silvestre]